MLYIVLRNSIFVFIPFGIYTFLYRFHFSLRPYIVSETPQFNTKFICNFHKLKFERIYFYVVVLNSTFICIGAHFNNGVYVHKDATLVIPTKRKPCSVYYNYILFSYFI